jgi:hypothetical protein
MSTELEKGDSLFSIEFARDGNEIEVRGVRRLRGTGTLSIPEIMEACFRECGI